MLIKEQYEHIPLMLVSIAVLQLSVVSLVLRPAFLQVPELWGLQHFLIRLLLKFNPPCAQPLKSNPRVASTFC